MGPLRIQRVGGGIRFAVRVQPRASKAEIVGVHGDALKVRVTAAPTDGSANEAVVALIAEALDVPRRAVSIIAGATSRAKIVAVEGASESQLQRVANGERR